MYDPRLEPDSAVGRGVFSSNMTISIGHHRMSVGVVSSVPVAPCLDVGFVMRETTVLCSFKILVIVTAAAINSRN